MYWWGKVESQDLVHYQEVTPFAMTGENIDMNYFTGSMVIDKHNTAGFGKDAYVAVYTILKKTPRDRSKAYHSVMTESRSNITRIIRYWISVVRSFVIRLCSITSRPSDG